MGSAASLAEESAASVLAASSFCAASAEVEFHRANIRARCGLVSLDESGFNEVCRREGNEVSGDEEMVRREATR